MVHAHGYRMIEGKAFLLDGTCGGVGPDDTKAKLAIEKQRKESQGLIVRFIKRCPSEYAVYTFPRG